MVETQDPVEEKIIEVACKGGNRNSKGRKGGGDNDKSIFFLSRYPNGNSPGIELI